jgi:hypothetical protein
MAGRMLLDRLIERYDFADFNRAAAHATSGDAIWVGSAFAAVTTAPAISPRSGWQLPAVTRI